MTKTKFQLSRWQHMLALGFGAGLAPRAPGTFGTLVAIPFVIALAALGLVWYLVFLLAGTVLGIYICGKTARDVGEHDHGAIVWDEIIGYALTMLLVPVSVQSLLIGFLLFRFFDILKPWPIRWLDRRIHGGLGIMLDDLMAAVPAWLILQLLLYYQLLS
ncbi:phosphatidylglycerophosphatase A family protein [Arsukibacterium indicum]|uniref:Phosphatidylglycerophosphatase A n=1 Tax=Arsukibacterium indicum TaxID=2848612 RepID=A0ABS6MGU7_9GAMM|nr:phosphatidylglycerophosphatase A [Arsukibacterium indicum]MBV2128037.1 phosphatidylglycerophosphatase A [Arsukibacterium indicum]